MPSPFETIFESTLAFFEKSEEQVFTWGGVDYTCTANDVATEKDFESEGYRLRVAVDIEASASQFGGTYPETKAIIQYDGHTLAVGPDIRRDAAAIRFRAYKNT